MALEQLLAVRATMDFHCRELELKAELMSHLNEAQFTETIKEAEVHCTTITTALQQAHMDSLLMVECEVKAEEGQECQAFMDALRAAMQGCLLETHGALMFPLQLLTGDVPLATILGMLVTAQLQAVADSGLVQTPPTPSALGTPAPKMGSKCQCHSSDQGVPVPGQDEEKVGDIYDIPDECPCKKLKDVRLAGKALKEAQRKAFF